MGKLVINRKGLEQLLRSPKVLAECEQIAERVAATANGMDNRDAGEPEGYAVSSGQGRSRARANVYTRTQAAKADNAKHNTLIRALGSGR